MADRTSHLQLLKITSERKKYSVLRTKDAEIFCVRARKKDISVPQTCSLKDTA
jgi:hypothetical protein